MPLASFSVYEDLLPRTANGTPCLLADGRLQLPAIPMGEGMAWEDWAPFAGRWSDPDLMIPSSLNGLKALANGQPQALYEHLTANPSLPQGALNEALSNAVKPLLKALSEVTLAVQEMCVALLLARGAQCGQGLLVVAITNGNPRLLHRLLTHLTPDAQTELTNPTPRGLTQSPLLSMAAEPLYIDEEGPAPYVMARQLIDAGASPDIQDSLQLRSGLHWAATRRRPGVVQALLEAGANDRVLSPRGHTVLHFAAAANSVATMRLLIDHGADPQADVPWIEVERLPVELGFELTRLARPNVADEISTWVTPSVIRVPRFPRTARPDPTLQAPPRPQITVVPETRTWHDTPLLQAAHAGAPDALAFLMGLGVDPCPRWDTSDPASARDERAIALLEQAWRDASSDGDEARQARAAHGRTLIERRLFADLANQAAGAVQDTTVPGNGIPPAGGRRRL